MDGPIPVTRSSSHRSGESALSPTSPTSYPASPTSPASLTSPCSRANRPTVRIVTPSIASEPSAHPNDFDPNDPTQLQAKIYEQLFKLTNQLNNNARSLNTLNTPTTATPAYSPFNFISRWGGFFTSAAPALSAAAQESEDPMAQKAALDAAEYDALGQQFTTLVIISTFTANLIIAFLTLAYNIINSQATPQPKFIFEIGMFFALIGMAIHAGVIIISGRCAAIALKHSKKLTVEAQMKRLRSPPEDNENDDRIGVKALGASRVQQLDDEDDDSPQDGTPSSEGGDDQSPSTSKGKASFRQASSQLTPLTPTQSRPSRTPYAVPDHCPDDFMAFLRVCEALQLVGTATFFLGVTVLIFLIFIHRLFPIILVVGCVVGTCLFGWLAGFWKISATHQLLVAVGRKIGPGQTEGKGRKGEKLKKGYGKEKKSQRRWFRRRSGHGEHDLEKGPQAGGG